MLELNSPKWNKLTHAYGKASDIPALLEQLKTAPPPSDYQSEPWFSLWSALCHQYDVYTASYAAIPHIVSIAAARPITERLEYLNFVGSVESFRHRENAPTIPANLKKDYLASLNQAASLILECLGADSWGEAELKVLVGALAAVRGQYKLGTAIFELEEEVECPECESVFSARGYDFFNEIQRPASPARTQRRAAFNLANDIHADSGRVHAVVRRFVLKSAICSLK